MKRLIFLLFFASIAHGQTVNDFYVPSRGNGGKVVLAPKDTNGVQVPVLSVDPVNGLSGAVISKNGVINGRMDYWQRGTSLSSGTGARFLADQFKNDSTGSTYTVSRQDLPLGSTPGGSKYFHRTVVTSVAGSSNYALLQHDIEDVTLYANKQVTLSFWAKADAAKSIAVEFAQLFGTGGSPSSSVLSIGVTTVSLTTTLTRYSVTTTLPSISGKTLGTDPNTSRTTFLLWFDCGSGNGSRCNSLGQQSGTFDVTEVMLNEGPVGNTFQLSGLDLAGELKNVQRYYYKYDSSRGISGYGGNSTLAQYYFCLPVTMRILPTLDNTTTTGFTATAEVAGSSGNSISAISIFTGNSSCVRLDATTSGLIVGDGTSIRLTGGFLGFNASFN